ncbi:MAG: serine/threonine-protein kinase [Phycisphaerae bacterium]
MSPEYAWYQQEAALLAKVRSATDAARAPSIPGYDDFRELGRGGQGVVYRAVQRSTHRPVAVKVLLDGAFASESVRRRFEREVELVASLRHPNIVRIYDSGATEDGHPFCVMECIEGAALDELLVTTPPDNAVAPLDVRSAPSGGFKPGADVLRLASNRASLTLFATICDAVQHAHQRGVIHRDLKPSNIRIDNAGQPHVLDFGLAKSLDPSHAAQQAPMTISGHFMGSLPWASPEQVQGAPSLIDLRTDVYSLGVLLFQMLTGRFPYPVSGPFHEVVGHILHARPTRPHAIRAEIDDELQTIVLKCIEKEPERRYQSAGELLRDVRAYLNGEPIHAKRDSVWYSFRKRLLRYRLVALCSAAGLVLMAGLTATLFVLYGRATAAEQLAEQRRAGAEHVADRATRAQAALREMLESLDPWKTVGRDPQLLNEMLDQAAARLPQQLVEHPDAEADLHGTIGMTYWSLGNHAAARKQFAAQRELCRQFGGEDDPRALTAANHLAMMELQLGEKEEARRLLAETLERSRRVLGPTHLDTLNAQSNYAYVLHELGRVEDAAELHLASLEARRRLTGPDDPETITSLNNYASCLRDLDRLDEAEPLMREVLERRRRVLGDDHPDTAIAFQNLAAALDDRGDLQQAESLDREALRIFRKRLGEQHESTAMAMSNLASLLTRRGRTEEAETLLRAAIDADRKALGPDHEQTLSAANNLANLLCEQQRPADAEPLARQVAEASRRTLGAEHPRTLTALSNLAMILADVGQTEQAETLCREVLETRRRVMPACHAEIVKSLVNLGTLLRDQERFDESLLLLHEALDCAAKTLPEGHWLIARVQDTLGHTLARAERYAEAEPFLLAGYVGLRAALGPEHAATRTSRQRLHQLYMDWNKPERASEYAP